MISQLSAMAAWWFTTRMLVFEYPLHQREILDIGFIELGYWD